MRILHLITRGAGGGTERNLRATIAHEQALGHNVHLAAGNAAQPEHYPPETDFHRVPSLVRQIQPRADRQALAELRSLVRTHDFDVVQTHESKAGILGRAAAAAHARTLVHTIHMASFGPGYSRPASAAFRSAERYCARLTTFFVSVGEELASQYIEAGIGRPEQYSIVRSPIDLHAYVAARDFGKSERSALRAALGFGANHRILLAAGMLEPRKRFDLVIRELAPLLRTGGALLVIAGDGSEREPLEDLAKSLGVTDGVCLVGHTGRLAEIMAVSEVLVQASRAEGVPQVALQALAAGLPVVATRVEGLREVAGAPIIEVPRDGSQLRAAVMSVLGASRPDPVRIGALAQWSDAAIIEQREALLQRFERHLATRAPISARRSVPVQAPRC